MNYWFEESLSHIPEEFQKISSTKYIQRRNIREVEDGGYICDARIITVEQYNEIMERREEIKQVVLETTNTAAYEDGYQAAMILLGGEE